MKQLYIDAHKSQFNLKLGNYEFKLKLSSVIFLNQLETHTHTKSQLDRNLAFELEIETSPILIQLKTTLYRHTQNLNSI